MSMKSAKKKAILIFSLLVNSVKVLWNVFHLLLKILILFLLPVRLISEKYHKMKQHTLIIFHSNIA